MFIQAFRLTLGTIGGILLLNVLTASFVPGIYHGFRLSSEFRDFLVAFWMFGCLGSFALFYFKGRAPGDKSRYVGGTFVMTGTIAAIYALFFSDMPNPLVTFLIGSLFINGGMSLLVLALFSDWTPQHRQTTPA